MATKSKGNGQTVKEKRGTSPYPGHSDPPAAAQRRRSPTDPAAAAATSSNQKSTPLSTASNSAEKQVPNYLKPTKSSRNDASKPSPKKQPFTDFTTPKPTPLTRRRSFDKPPSPSRVPKPNATSPNSTERSLRSSSFSSKTAPLAKAQLEKFSKATKEPRASNVRKSIVTNSKKQNGASSSRTSTSKATRASSPHAITDNSLKTPELQHKGEESSPTTDHAAEEINDQKLPAEIMQLEEDKEHVNVDLVNEAEMDESEELKHCDSCTVTEDQKASLSVDMEESQGETPTEENVNDHQEADQESSKEEILESRHQVQGSDIASALEVDGEKKETGEEEMASADPKENSSELKEEVEKSKEVPPKSEEAVQVERVVKGPNKPEEANVVKKSQGGSSSSNGKKDTAAYNDVIEETASKLREQRKNKVKALVGAFETVISLESDTTAE